MSSKRTMALLRGINVGGRNRVPMADLRTVASELGFESVATYIQSGNLVFATDLDEAAATSLLENAIEERFGFPVPVVMRSGDELTAIASAHPLAGYEPDPRRLMVAFLSAAPAVSIDAVIDARAHDPDRYLAEGREVYLAYPDGQGRSKLTHALLESRLGVRATIRNWNTIQKLAELVGAE